MTVVVEDGTGVAASQVWGVTVPADTVTFVQDLKDYWTSVGYDYTTAGYSDGQIEQAGLRGFRWVNNKYRSRFPGKPVNAAQGLHFPATDVDDTTIGPNDVYGNEIALDSVPSEAFQAGAEAAFEELKTPHCLTPNYQRSVNQVVETAKAGSASVTYSDAKLRGDVTDVLPDLSVVDNILSRLIGKPSSDPSWNWR